MNWDAIGAIAELLGAIGVIASLVYLATQIRQSWDQMSQNTRALRGAAYQQWDDSLQATVMQAVTVPALDRVVHLGLADYEQLSEEDAFRFEYWIASLMRRYDAAYYQHRTGMLDEGRWQLPRRDIAAFLANPGALQWWRSMFDANLSPEFIALVEEILGEDEEGDDRPE
jgi:hypothetical protein